MKARALSDNIMYGLLKKFHPFIMNIFRKVVLRSTWLNKSTETASDAFTELDSAQ